MFRTSTFASLQAPREVAVDVEVYAEETEYQDVAECVQDATQHQAQIQKVIRHKIPGCLYNGGKACRVSWSVLAQLGGQTMHYTVYNCDRTQRQAVAPTLTSHGFYLRSARQMASHAH